MIKTHTFLKDLRIQRLNIFPGKFNQVTLTKLLFQNISFEFQISFQDQGDQHLKILILPDFSRSFSLAFPGHYT